MSVNSTTLYGDTSFFITDLWSSASFYSKLKLGLVITINLSTSIIMLYGNIIYGKMSKVSTAASTENNFLNSIVGLSVLYSVSCFYASITNHLSSILLAGIQYDYCKQLCINSYLSVSEKESSVVGQSRSIIVHRIASATNFVASILRMLLITILKTFFDLIVNGYVLVSYSNPIQYVTLFAFICIQIGLSKKGENNKKSLIVKKDDSHNQLRKGMLEALENMRTFKKNKDSLQKMEKLVEEDTRSEKNLSTYNEYISLYSVTTSVVSLIILTYCAFKNSQSSSSSNSDNFMLYCGASSAFVSSLHYMKDNIKNLSDNLFNMKKFQEDTGYSRSKLS